MNHINKRLMAVSLICQNWTKRLIHFWKKQTRRLYTRKNSNFLSMTKVCWWLMRRANWGLLQVSTGWLLPKLLFQKNCYVTHNSYTRLMIIDSETTNRQILIFAIWPRLVIFLAKQYTLEPYKMYIRLKIWSL